MLLDLSMAILDEYSDPESMEARLRALSNIAAEIKALLDALTEVPDFAETSKIQINCVARSGQRLRGARTVLSVGSYPLIGRRSHLRPG